LKLENRKVLNFMYLIWCVEGGGEEEEKGQEWVTVVDCRVFGTFFVEEIKKMEQRPRGFLLGSFMVVGPHQFLK
jgi:hypothetical protein